MNRRARAVATAVIVSLLPPLMLTRPTGGPAATGHAPVSPTNVRPQAWHLTPAVTMPSRTPAAATASPSPRPTPSKAPTPRAAGVDGGVPRRPIDCAVAKCVALTFDDGPGEETPRLLALLRRRGVKVTFFFLGAWAELHPQTVRQAAADHHVIGTHSWNHPHFTQISDAQVMEQVTRSSRTLHALSGQPIDLLRPPYGEMRAPFPSTGKAIILWNTDTKDYLHWKTPRPDLTIAAALAQARPGSILLLHDSHGPSVDAVGPIVDHLTARGYVFVTIPELLRGRLTADTVYRHG